MLNECGLPRSACTCYRQNLTASDLHLDTIERLAKGKTFINLDIDRQDITVFGTPEQIDAHISRCVRVLGSPRGGLSMVWGVYPGTPLANIEAGARAMDQYATYWS